MSDYPDSPPRSRKVSLSSSISTPSTRRVATSTLQSSPHYSTSRRHSLYGTEDRVVIDPGSRIWKVGFSGESRPRAVFPVSLADIGMGESEHASLWELHNASSSYEAQIEKENQLYRVLIHQLRRVFHDVLLTDPKSRKVIIVESPLIPLFVKELLCRVLFEQLQVPSVSFAPSGLLSLVGVGRITGLVVDCGHLETTVTPVSFSTRSTVVF
jgi:actin-related protein 10